jgi:hypothetical protein
MVLRLGVKPVILVDHGASSNVFMGSIILGDACGATEAVSHHGSKNPNRPAHKKHHLETKSKEVHPEKQHHLARSVY